MEENTRLLKALANDTRIRILQHLLDGERCACSVVPGVRKAQSTVSGHLRVLERAGIVESRRVGTNIWYRIKSREAKQILEILRITKIVTVKECRVG